MRANTSVIGVLGMMAALGLRAASNAPVPTDVAGGSAQREAIAILQTGSLHGDEVPADPAGDWLALVRDGGGAAVHPVSVSLVPERDMMDEDGEETGRRVEVQPALDPIVLVRGLAWFTGPVTTVLMDERVDVDHALEARLNTVSSRLSVRCGEASRVEGQRQQRCTLVVQRDAVTQAVFTYSAYFEGAKRLWASNNGPFVLWAGDLDLDGRLDLLLDTSDHENVEETRLFLSSAAKPGQLLSEVALFRHVGC
jgi:hypothetical protein